MNIYEVQLIRKVKVRNGKTKILATKTKTVYLLFAGNNAAEAKAKAKQTVDSPDWKAGKANCIINNK